MSVLVSYDCHCKWETVKMPFETYLWINESGEGKECIS